MQKVITMNPFEELFDTVNAIEYLNANGKKIARITLKKNYSHLGRLLNARTKVYLKRELDAFIAGEDYTPDPDYESAIFDNLFTTEQVADMLNVSYANMRQIMSRGQIEYQKFGNTPLFIQQFIDDYQEKTS